MTTSYLIRLPMTPGGPRYDLCCCDCPEAVAAVLTALLPRWDWARGSIEVCADTVASAHSGDAPPWKEV